MRSAAKNFILLSSSEIISKALGFLTTVLIARRVGVDGLGDIGFVLAVYTYFTFLANPGYDTIGAREIVRKDIDSSRIINSIFILKFWSSILAFLFLLVVCFLIPFSPSVKQLLMLQGLSLLTIPFAFQFFFRGGNQMQVVAFSRLLQSGMYFITVFIGVHGISDLIRVPIAFGISTVTGFLPMFGLIRQHCSLHLKVKVEQLRSIFIAALTVGAASICVQVYLNMDTVLLGFFKTSREVGLYISAYKIVTLASVIPSLVFASYLPYLVSLKNTTAKEWRTFVLTMFIIGLPTGIFIGIYAPELIAMLYGSTYNDAVLPLRLLSLDIIAVFLSVTFAQPLLLLGKEKKYLSIVAWSAGLNLLLNLFLIPLYGMTGAALTTIFAETMVAVRSWRALTLEVPMTFMKEVFNILRITVIGLMVMVLCVFLFSFSLRLSGIAFIAVYGILMTRWYRNLK
ncbi:MAG: flippase [Ignavibacteriales bacterium]|nr:flippase [Ignavibacteriales bacterium]